MATPPAASAEPDATSEARLLRHGERPLRSEDFQAPVPEKRPDKELRIEAFSHTAVRYDYRSRVRRRAGKYIAQVDSFEAYAVFDPSKSWNAQPDNVQLLEHHQGHFDLAQITALDILREVAQRRKRNQLPTGTGSSENEATADLEQQLDRLVAGHTDALEQQHEYFDRVTRYGTLSDVEKQQRKQQQEILRRRNSAGHEAN